MIIKLRPPKSNLGSQLSEVARLIGGTIASDENLELDFSEIDFIYPNWITPISAYLDFLRKRGRAVKLTNCERLSYLKTIYFYKPLNPAHFQDWEERLNHHRLKTYLPICAIPCGVSQGTVVDQFLSSLTDVVQNQLKAPIQFKSALSYFLSELSNNTMEHANTDVIWCSAQYYPENSYLDICLCDTGIGFLESYKRHGQLVLKDDADAIEVATKGFSTKNIEQNRGFGLKTSRRMILEGFKGRMGITSGTASRIDLLGQEPIIVTHELNAWQGVLINIRLFPDNSFNLSDFYE